MALANPITSTPAGNVAIIAGLGGLLLATGGGNIQAPPVVQIAGSSDAVCTLYDGTSTSGTPIAIFSLAAGGPVMMPNTSYSALYADITGTSAGQVQVAYTGQAAA